MSPAVVRWQFDLATTGPLRLLGALAVGLVAGPFLGVVALVLTTLASADLGLAAVVVVVALVVGLGVGSGRVMFVLGRTRTGSDAGFSALSRRVLAASVLCGAGLCVAALQWTPVGFEFVLGSWAVGFVALVVGAGLRSEGAVDRDTGTLTYGSRTVSLGAIQRLRSVRLGRFVVALVRYQSAVAPSTPRVVVLSADARDAVESSLTSHEPTPADADRERAATAVRAVAAAFGLACVAVGPAVWFLVPDGRFLAAYLGAFGLLFGVVFLRYALVA